MVVRDPYEIPESPKRRLDESARGARQAKSFARRMQRLARAAKPTRINERIQRRSAQWQRSTVKVSFRRNQGSGQWRAHGRYIGRESARPDPENRGLGFDGQQEDAHVSDTLGGWEKDGDSMLWKVVVSPENGDRMDLHRHSRELVARMEDQLGTKLEWVGVVHSHSDHPHAHLVIRGIDERGKSLQMPDQFVKHEIRWISRELATEELGKRTAADVARAREAGVQARYVGALDRKIDQEAGSDREITFHHEPHRSHPRQQVWRRLEMLTELGLATREGHSWTVARDVLPALRNIQKLGDVHRTIHDREIALTEPKPDVRFTDIEPGRQIVGRVAGAMLDERSDRSSLLVEGTDGPLHVIRMTAAIERKRGEGGLANGTLVTLRGRSFESKTGQTRRAVSIRTHGNLDDARQEEPLGGVLDQASLRAVRETGRAPSPDDARSRFASQFFAAARDRFERLRAAGIVVEIGDAEGERSFRLAQGVQLDMEADQGRERTPLQEIRRRSDKPVVEAAEQAGQKIRGTFQQYAQDANGKSYAVLDTGAKQVAVPTEQTDLAVGQEVEAQSQSERDSERRRIVIWQIQDVERLREQSRSRER